MIGKLPSDENAERALLSCLLVDSGCLDDVRAVLPGAEGFADLRHQILYRAILLLADALEPVSIVTLDRRLKSMPDDRGRAEDLSQYAGGYDYLLGLAMDGESAAHALHYAWILADQRIKRQALVQAERLYLAAQDPTVDGQALLGDFEETALALSDGVARQGVIVSAGEIAERAVNRVKAKQHGETDGLATGWTWFDRLSGGFVPADLIILGGRPSMGKTSWAEDVSLNIAERGVPVGFFSIETGEESLSIRLISNRSGKDSVGFRDKLLSGNDLLDCYAAGDRLKETPVWLDFAANVGLAHFRRTARKMVARYGCRLIVVDYLQFMDVPKADRHDLGVGMLTRGMKQTAKELRVPVIALSQLRRPPAGSVSPPQLSDLRDSGNIEQDADMVIFLHRPGYYDKAISPEQTEVIIAKNRNGKTGTAEMWFNRECGRFSETTREAQ